MCAAYTTTSPSGATYHSRRAGGAPFTGTGWWGVPAPYQPDGGTVKGEIAKPPANSSERTVLLQ